mgnify:CR=1 FL=1
MFQANEKATAEKWARRSGGHGKCNRDQHQARPCDRVILALAQLPSWLKGQKAWTEIATWRDAPAGAEVKKPTAEFLGLRDIAAIFR